MLQKLKAKLIFIAKRRPISRKLVGALSFVIGHLLTHLTPNLSHCAINKNFRHIKLKKLSLKSCPDFSRGANLAIIQPMDSVRTIREKDIQQIIPSDLSPNSSSDLIATQILDHSLSSFFNSESVKKSDFGRTAHKVEKSMQGNIQFGGQEPESIHHSLKLAFKATKTQAQLEYSGITNANLNYSLAQNRIDLELHENLAQNTQIVFNHIDQPAEISDILSLRWHW